MILREPQKLEKSRGSVGSLLHPTLQPLGVFACQESYRTPSKSASFTPLKTSMILVNPHFQ